MAKAESSQNILQRRIDEGHGYGGSNSITFKMGFNQDNLIFPTKDTTYKIEGKEFNKKQLLNILDEKRIMFVFIDMPQMASQDLCFLYIHIFLLFFLKW